MEIESLYQEYSDHNFFWFIRDLTKGAYDGFGKKQEKCLEIHEELESNFADSTTEELLDIFEERVLSNYKEGNKNYDQIVKLINATKYRVNDKDDIKDLSLALYCSAKMSKYINNTKYFTEEDIERIVKNVVRDGRRVIPENAFDALLSVDTQGEHLNLASQRENAVKLLNDVEEKFDGKDKHKYESALIQWYEMRCGNSRVSNAGSVLEKALDMIFEESGIPSEGNPEHYGDLEIDNKITGEKTVGISCKRTQRERLKQSYPRQELNDLDEIWFVTLQLGDVSESKLKEMSNFPIRMYVPEESSTWKMHKDNDEVQKVLFPAEEFLEDISQVTGNPLNT